MKVPRLESFHPRGHTAEQGLPEGGLPEDVQSEVMVSVPSRLPDYNPGGPQRKEWTHEGVGNYHLSSENVDHGGPAAAKG